MKNYTRQSIKESEEHTKIHMNEIRQELQSAQEQKFQAFHNQMIQAMQNVYQTTVKEITSSQASNKTVNQTALSTAPTMALDMVTTEISLDNVETLPQIKKDNSNSINCNEHDNSYYIS
mmetsp:Transcript_15494/g.22086  ORF Transcript_15494/g.22086 Transcript_15494/m.22086 type:complete len:119 (-) Transcript_15494:391-747(-)|eukprot:CAMPEP_0184868442 /NCGR_PEP_ID=MMETSP0580-20130426/30441_1 /TAXON_ID=1118495 /ORGANISM="Dactyliosolen fragilissimus" /LENGTH=118 /DNA_ID=CAMNT_0027369337 /DNA_START=214 /DNA_END=570 /DNA_ORIENTATION=-